MKKNISINISGIIFHIEEDGYDNLKKYLDSINRYFSSFEDSSEILADIESRIAEIFLSKLNEEKQVITSEDVNALISTMGSVSDFKAAEETADTETSHEHAEEQAGEAPHSGPSQHVPPRRLFRDQKRKILGGVSAGLGNYFNMDPLWFRLLFVALLFAGGFTLVVYILMWIILPGSYTLEEPEFGKKMFRDPQSRIIGGVSGGIAAYFNIDLILVRFLFVLLVVAGGLGILLYVILWVCLPEARSITDKMQMQGEPVTLSNIESNIKKNLNIGEGEQESTLARILLFPFRLLGALLTALGKILHPLADVIRILMGAAIILAGASTVFIVVVVVGILFGIFAGGALPVSWMTDLPDVGLSFDVFARAFPTWIAFAAAAAIIIPSVFIILLGASIIANKLVFRSTAGWSLFALFFISVALLAVGIPRIIYAFHEEGTHRVQQTYTVTGKTAVLKLNESRTDYRAVQLSLRGHDEPTFRLDQRFEAQGASRSQAIENAKMVEYDVAFQDSVFIFDHELEFKDDAIFRGQRLKMILYIPYDFPFTMEENFSRFISQYVDKDYMDGYTWKMTRDGLECINCRTESDATANRELRDFEAVKISGKFDVRIVQGDGYSVEMSGAEGARSQYSIHVADRTLIVDYRRDKRINWDDWERRGLSIGEMGITIIMPAVERVETSGLGKVRLEDIRGDRFEIESRGPVNITGNIQVHDLALRLTGKSTADLSGRTNNMNAHIEFASRLGAYDLETRKAFVEVGGASSAKVNVTETLEIDEGIASDIDYRGNPEVRRHN